ncbi:zincin-like metallopeptidase domain-containing protein [Mucilaginibacter terrae]|uniref:Antirestriction protein ArdC n=1 Tax=Mucilaginibacter terrae TaxID=1955052 RepID=A0ABU3GND1_9SPHI|nr:zincin-like metallopeptidase domain-containing protein [Mucilaginibacter terrae]MDT3401295.1 antirestriction protein ArdC [Mucilaginibacter terrae]
MEKPRNYKPFYLQVAEKLTAALSAGTSAFQQPVKENGQPAYIKPINPTTGKGYSALNALALALKGHEDPRWMTAEAARFAGYLVKKDSRGTMITFPKTSDIQAIRKPDGSKITDEAGVTQTRLVEYEKPEKGVAFLFNGSQIDKIEPLEEFLAKEAEGQTLSPIERADQLIKDSKAVVIEGGQEAYYDAKRDAIFLPEKDQFPSETAYYQTAIHQLAHWTGHESRQNRPMEGKFGSQEYAKEEFRAAMAAMIIGAELKLGHDFGPHKAYTGQWVKMLKEEPYEIARVAKDAQRIANAVLGVGKKQEVAQEVVQGEAPAVSTTLKKGDAVVHNNTTYTVLAKKGKTLDMEKADTGEKFKLKPTDALYGKLVEAKNNPVEIQVAEEQDQEQEQTREQEQVQEQSYSRGR